MSESDSEQRTIEFSYRHEYAFWNEYRKQRLRIVELRKTWRLWLLFKSSLPDRTERKWPARMRSAPAESAFCTENSQSSTANDFGKKWGMSEACVWNPRVVRLCPSRRTFRFATRAAASERTARPFLRCKLFQHESERTKTQLRWTCDHPLSGARRFRNPEISLPNLANRTISWTLLASRLFVSSNCSNAKKIEGDRKRLSPERLLQAVSKTRISVAGRAKPNKKAASIVVRFDNEARPSAQLVTVHDARQQM